MLLVLHLSKPNMPIFFTNVLTHVATTVWVTYPQAKYCLQGEWKPNISRWDDGLQKISRMTNLNTNIQYRYGHRITKRGERDDLCNIMESLELIFVSQDECIVIMLFANIYYSISRSWNFDTAYRDMKSMLDFIL